ncbi:MAG: helix-turn-helix transcriptional regulator [Gammaproteobacteria bacterium]|nr:helix-turn-helix transcriptional regulator [Gammaproteobacteria bacterium]
MLSKDELNEMYNVRKMSQREIADSVGCTQGTINKWMKLHKVKARSLSETRFMQVMKAHGKWNGT